MDGGGRLDQPLTRSGPIAAEGGGPRVDGPRHSYAGTCSRRSRTRRFAWPTSWRRLRVPPHGVGVAASIVLLAATLAYGAIAGGHVVDVVSWLKDARDGAANAVGFRIAAVSLTGSKAVSREQILTIAGVTGRASLLFLDADAARARLLANPWIADAAVLKLYPDRLQITVTERVAFALWQKDAHVSVIAEDGTVLEPFVEDRYRTLPMVVGRGAARQAKNFLAVIARFPDVKTQLGASVFVAERRWNLRLNSGIDVRLPEGEIDQALGRLETLDRDKKLLSRDIIAVDLRLPDRVTVRLSDAAAQSREDAFKDRKKKKAGDA